MQKKDNLTWIDNLLQIINYLSTEELLIKVINGFDNFIEEDILVFIDNFHLLLPPQGNEDKLLFNYLPHRLNLILLSRDELSYTFCKFRAADQFFMLTGEELAFDVAEINELSLKKNTSLSVSELEWIHKKTEGWPLMVSLLLNFWSENRGRAADDLTSLFDNFIYNLEQRHKRFIEETFFLDELDIGLCQHLLPDQSEVERIIKHLCHYHLVLKKNRRKLQVSESIQGLHAKKI